MCICMYVCVYVCMCTYVCMYLCVYVCMYVCCMYVCMHQMCSNFLAGGMIRSANRYKALDETAVFGFCCRHEFPGRFINLKHGEWFVNCHEFYCVKCYWCLYIGIGWHMVRTCWKRSWKICNQNKFRKYT